MTKLEKRQAMKALAIAKMTCEQVASFIKFNQALNRGDLYRFQIAMMRHALESQQRGQFVELQQTPARLFRTDRPELDPRRVKREQRGGVYVSVDHGQPGGDSTAIAVVSGGRQCGKSKARELVAQIYREMHVPEHIVRGRKQ